MRAAVFLAECRCFCCAKMVRGAANLIGDNIDHPKPVSNRIALVACILLLVFSNRMKYNKLKADISIL